MADQYTSDYLPAGFTLKVGVTPNDIPPTFEFAVVRKMGFPKTKRGMSDANDITDDSTEKLKAPGFYEEEPIPFEVRMRSDDYDQLRVMFLTGDRYPWATVFPLIGNQVQAAEFDFFGFVEELGVPEITQGSDERVNVAFTIKADSVSFSQAT